MSRPVPRFSELAQKILEQELGQKEAPQQLATAWEGCCHRLGEALVNLVGEAGFLALLYRAAQLTRPAVSWVDLICRPGSATIPGNELAEIARCEGGPKVTAGLTALLANLIGLLCSFIGEELTLQLVYRTWTTVGREAPACGQERASK